MAGHTIIINWFGEQLSRSDIARRYNVPVSTVYTYFSRYETHEQIRERLLGRTPVVTRPEKKYPYKDGRYLTIKEILKLEPNLTGSRLRYRYKRFPGNFEKIFEPNRSVLTKKPANKEFDNSYLSEMGPRLKIEQVPGPTVYEEMYC